MAIKAPNGQTPLLEDEAGLLFGRSASSDGLRRLHAAFRGRQIDVRQPSAGRRAVPHSTQIRGGIRGLRACSKERGARGIDLKRASSEYLVLSFEVGGPLRSG